MRIVRTGAVWAAGLALLAGGVAAGSATATAQTPAQRGASQPSGIFALQSPAAVTVESFSGGTVDASFDVPQIPRSVRGLRYQLWLYYPEDRTGNPYEGVGGGRIPAQAIGGTLKFSKRVCGVSTACKSNYRLGVQLIGKVGRITVQSPIRLSEEFGTR